MSKKVMEKEVDDILKHMLDEANASLSNRGMKYRNVKENYRIVTENNY